MLSSQFFIICAAVFARGFAVLDSDDDILFIQHRANVGIETDEHATWEARSNLANEANSLRLSASVRQCMTITTGSSEFDDGYLDLWVRIDGANQRIHTDRYFDRGSTVLDNCYPEVDGVFVRNTRDDEWVGSMYFYYTIDGQSHGAHYMYCNTCAAYGTNGVANKITVDGNDDSRDRAITHCLRRDACYITKQITLSPTPSPTIQPVLADAMPLTLETNSLGGDGGLLRFSNVAPDGTELVVKNTTEYTPFNANVTGLAAPLSSLAQISLGCGDTVEMKFEFIIDSQPVIPSAFNFTVADLDKGAKDRCSESVEISDSNAFFLYPDLASSSINMTETAGRLRFTGLTVGSVDDNPENIFDMTAEQKMKSVTFLVEGKNNFTMTFATIEPEESSTDPDVVGYNGRRILFGLGNP